MMWVGQALAPVIGIIFGLLDRDFACNKARHAGREEEEKNWSAGALRGGGRGKGRRKSRNHQMHLSDVCQKGWSTHTFTFACDIINTGCPVITEHHKDSDASPHRSKGKEHKEHTERRKLGKQRMSPPHNWNEFLSVEAAIQRFY